MRLRSIAGVITTGGGRLLDGLKGYHATTKVAA
jgi:hypothetical protein